MAATVITTKATINNHPESRLTNSQPANQNVVGQDIEELLKENASTSIKDPHGKVALHYCTENGDLELVEKIYEGDPGLLDHKDEEGYTPLTFAVIGGNSPVVDFLISKGADVNNVDAEKHSMVHWATVCCHKGLLENLLTRGALVGVPDLYGSQALHYATQLCNVDEGADILKTLLRHGADVNCTDLELRTPLLWAASCGSQEAFVALVEAGADKKCVDKDQLTTIHCAASRGHGDMIELILKLSVDVQIDAKDKNGCSPLFYAATLGYAECTKILLKHGAQPNLQDKKLRTVAHCAAARGQLTTLKYLWNFGASLDLENHRGDLPIHEAVQAGSLEVAAFLLTVNGTNVNARNHFGRAPLHLASANGNLALCQLLVSKGATVDSLMISKTDILTSLDVAEKQSQEDVVEYLKSLQARNASALPESEIEAFKMTFTIKIPEKKSTLIESTVQTDNLPEKRDQYVEVDVVDVQQLENATLQKMSSPLLQTTTDENNLNKPAAEKPIGPTKKKSKVRKSMSLGRLQKSRSKDSDSETRSDTESSEEIRKNSRKYLNHKKSKNSDLQQQENDDNNNNRKHKKHHHHHRHHHGNEKAQRNDKSLENIKDYDSLSLPDSEVSATVRKTGQRPLSETSNETLNGNIESVEKNKKKVHHSKSLNKQLSLITEEMDERSGTPLKNMDRFRNDLDVNKMFEHNDFDQSFNDGKHKSRIRMYF